MKQTLVPLKDFDSSKPTLKFNTHPPPSFLFLGYLFTFVFRKLPCRTYLQSFGTAWQNCLLLCSPEFLFFSPLFFPTFFFSSFAHSQCLGDLSEPPRAFKKGWWLCCFSSFFLPFRLSPMPFTASKNGSFFMLWCHQLPHTPLCSPPSPMFCLVSLLWCLTCSLIRTVIHRVGVHFYWMWQEKKNCSRLLAQG